MISHENDVLHPDLGPGMRIEINDIFNEETRDFRIDSWECKRKIR